MAYRHIIYEKEGNIARITLNKPEKMNTYAFISVGEDFAEVLKGFQEAEEDDDVKVVVLKGAGRAFSTGHDLSKVGFLYGFGTGQQGVRRPSQRIRLKMDRDGLCDGFKKIFLHPKLTIAQVHGYCLEGGLMLAMCCDFIVCAEDAQFGFPGQRLGFAGSGEHTFSHLVLTVGLKRAMDLFVTGRTISGSEAERIGLVSRTVPPDQLEGRVQELAEALCLLPRDGIAIGKATRHMFYDQMGLTAAFTLGYVSHTMFTNVRFEPGEFNFFRERREKGAKGAFHERDERFIGKA